MRLGEILVARGLVSVEDIAKAIERQKTEGGRLGQNLVALGLITEEALKSVMHETPRSPKTIAGTGIAQGSLLGLMLKFMYIEERETPAALIDGIKLPYNIVKLLLDDAANKKLVETLGAGGVGGMADVRYSLTSRGREMAADALERSQYLGPAPVSLAAYQDQVLKQRITNEFLDAADIEACFANLVIPPAFVRKVGPAINAGNTILLYGPAGNGKTSVATRIAEIFQHIVYVPYAFEVEGHIVQLYDSSIHQEPVDEEARARLAQQSEGTRGEDLDQRWVACHRPTAVVGGELTLDMLDLNYSESARFYEAPMHIKALNGTFIVDDFGRQIVSAEALLNRWIVPMESRIDFFKLRTGKSFYLPFDELLIFSTNMEPNELMDPAFLRRIPYKIELFEPSAENFRRTFEVVAANANLELPDDVFEYVVDQIQGRNNFRLAYYQPKFIVDQVLSACKFERVKPAFTRERVSDALRNLYVHIDAGEEPREAELVQLEGDD